MQDLDSCQGFFMMIFFSDTYHAPICDRTTRLIFARKLMADEMIFAFMHVFAFSFNNVLPVKEYLFKREGRRKVCHAFAH